MDGGNHRDAGEEGDYTLCGKGPGIARLGDPRSDEELTSSYQSGFLIHGRQCTYWIHKSAEIEQNGVEGDDAHGLQRVSVHDVAGHYRIADLETYGDLEGEPNVSMISRISSRRSLQMKNAICPTIQWYFLSMLTPQMIRPTVAGYQHGEIPPERCKLTSAQKRSWIRKPKPHLRHSDTAVFLCQLHNYEIAQPARAEDLCKEGAKNEPQEEKALNLRLVLGVSRRDISDHRHNPPIPREAKYEHRDRDD